MAVSCSCIVFLSVLWPDFSFRHLFWSLLLYQKNHSKIEERRRQYLENRCTLELPADEKQRNEAQLRREQFLAHHSEQQIRFLKELLKDDPQELSK